MTAGHKEDRISFRLFQQCHIFCRTVTGVTFKMPLESHFFMAAYITFCSVRNKKKIEVMDFKN